MSSARHLAPLLLALLAATPPGGATTGSAGSPAPAATAAAPGALQIDIQSPAEGQSAIGPTELRVDVRGQEPPAKVDFYFDSKLVRSFDQPPYSFLHDAGAENRAHRLDVVATTRAGVRYVAGRDLPKLKVDAEFNVDLRQLYVTVSRADKRVLDIPRDAFRVLEDGREQSIVTFEGGDVPLTAVLLLDSSESMAGGRLQSALRGARAFAHGMRPLDEASLLLFSDHLLRSTSFSTSPEPIIASMTDVKAAGGTSLNDALYVALKVLDARQGRRVVIFFSDGADVLSYLGIDDVLWKARRSQALIYFIRLQEKGSEYTSFSSAWRNVAQNMAEERKLEEAVRESGGRIATLASLDELDAAFREILAELREQYVIGYYPANPRHDGSWRSVKVKVDAGGVAVRTREGYADY